MKKWWNLSLILAVHCSVFLWLYACSDEATEPVLPAAPPLNKSYVTENVVVVVIDGPRYSETWGMEGRPLIPNMATKMAPEGTLFTNFKNMGPTYTLAGHTAITTGIYQNLSNDGTEIPLKPSVFQQYLMQTQQAPGKACLVTSKDKLNVLADSREMEWRGRFNPAFSCGEKGKNRPDSVTLETALKVLEKDQPSLMLVQFQGPDINGHDNDWNGYLESIQETDSLVYVLWEYLKKNEHYRNKTSLLITNDHGRHGNDHKDGFSSHGDGCDQCRHISLLALGPDFKAGAVTDKPYEQTDITPTIAQLLGFSVPDAQGKPILPLPGHQ